MFLKKSKNNKTGRTYLYIANGYHDKEKGYSKTVIVKSLGYLDVLEKQYPDPIAHFQEEVRKMNDEQINPNLKMNLEERIDSKAVNRKNFGYAAPSKIYHELEINKFFLNKFRTNKFSAYKINNIMKLLVFGRLLFPNSKRSTYENKDFFFENTDFSLDDVYRSLTYIYPYKDQLQKYIYARIRHQYGSHTECVYYDVTNYYFEVDEQDNLRKKGVSKEHRPNPIVQMGLFMDSLGMPISYKLFSGNTNDCLTIRPMIHELQDNYDIGKVIVVADKGLNTGNNIAYNVAIGNGYVMSLSIRGSNQDLKNFVLDEKDYLKKGDNYKIKSRQYPREIWITANGQKTKTTVDEKQVIFYSKDYDKRAKAERQPAIDKAKELIKNPIKFNKANSYGAAKYVKHLVFDKNTGEIIEAKSILSIDEEKLNEEEKYDGYYAIVTSEYQKTDDEIIDIYRGLWRIEETFKITKSELEARPVYVSRENHIEAHFLTCFIALVIARILQYRLDNNFSVGQILESLSKVCCSHVQENYYLFDYVDDVTSSLGDTLSIDFTKKFMSLQNIKKFLSDVKKSKFSQ